jgi:triacylglycerol lipase
LSASSERARGLRALVHDAVGFTLDRVEQGQSFAVSRVREVVEVVAPALAPIVNGVELLSSKLPLGTIRAVNRLIEAGGDLLPALRLFEVSPIALRSDITGTEAWLADAALGSLNGAVGDYLAASKNTLDLGLSLRAGDAYFSGASSLSGRVAVFVHGLGTTEWSWCWDAAAYHGDPAVTFGTLLSRDLGITPVYARYNTGRRVVENGRLLADAMEAAFASSRVEELVLIGHSMGGLVVRSACRYAEESGQTWISRVKRAFYIGTPHQGAPLEKLGAIVTNVLDAVDHPGAAIPAEIIRRRSEGVRDLREGLGEDVPLSDRIAHHFIAATMTGDRDHPLGRLLGDILVRVPSASGPMTSRAELTIATECFSGIMHHQLQNHPDIYAWIRAHL